MPARSFELGAGEWLSKYRNYVPLQWSFDSEVTKSSSRRFRAIAFLGGAFVIILIATLFIFNLGSITSVNTKDDGPHGGSVTAYGWTKPAGLMVVAIVFYGRRSNVQILERYLRVPLLYLVLLTVGKFGG